ncbi:MAG: hypothetical protein AB8D78_09475 [Akkermansiaceae bacterium]
MALEPNEVDENVDVEVDRTESIWKVKVTNRSSEELRYEMMGEVPRGLALELWDFDETETGVRIHAEDLAKYLGVDGFPADIRTIPAGEVETFFLNPKSMSATNKLSLAKWERAKRGRYYQCRVVFGRYSSRMLDVSPKVKIRKSSNEPEPEWVADLLKNTKEDEPFGFQIRKMLNEKDLALIDWHKGSDRKDVYHASIRTAPKGDFEKLVAHDGTRAASLPLQELVKIAKKAAAKKIEDCEFEGLMVNPSEDDQLKYFYSIYFTNDEDDTEIHLLSNGTIVQDIRIELTKEQYDQLSEYRIPQLIKK